MKILSGPGNNSKLGKNVMSWSRPVGPSCPVECPFLSGVLPDGSRLPQEGLCYADRAEKASPAIHEAWGRNAPGKTRKEWWAWGRQLAAELSEAGKAGYAVRGHVGGDFLLPNGDLDILYIKSVIWAFRHASPRPAAWFYTHCWKQLCSSWRHCFERVGVEVFASVHCPEDGWKARSMGFRLAIDGGEMPEGGGPAWVSWIDGGIKALACPEQKSGHDVIDCSRCGYCFRKQSHHGDVLFRRHGPGTKTPKTGGKHIE